MADWINVLGLVVGVLGLGVAFYQYRERTKLENAVRDTLRRLAGQVNVIYSNAYWADGHLRAIAKMFSDSNQDLPRMNKEAVDGARDAATCARQLSQVHSQIQGIQMWLFKDSDEEILPDLPSDDVRAAKERLEQKKASHSPKTITQKAP